jgi:hypothetical protein
LIDYDTSSGLPTGTIGWTRLFEAIEQAEATDETEWIEYKAGVDPSNAAGRAHIARAILAFANRDPQRAAQWLGGHGLVIVGLEPGNNAGCRQIDPAQVHDGLQRLLKAPAPDWDHAYHRYNGKHVLVITVSPPKQGDPIALPAKSSDVLVDGRVYARQPGKSEQATSDDIRRLEARARPAVTAPTVSVTATMDGPLCRTEPNAGWMERWLTAERQRLLAPLEEEIAKRRPPNPAPWNFDAELLARGDRGRSLRDILSEMPQQPLAGRASLMSSLTEDPEDRSEQEYRDEVDAYVGDCREKLPKAVGLLMATQAPEVVWQVRNESPDNLQEVEVKVHLEGRVFQIDALGDPLRAVCPSPPRRWGPRQKPNLAHSLSQQVMVSRPSQPYPPSAAIGPRTQITNGGSVDIVFPPVHLRAHETKTLDEITGLTLARDFEGIEVQGTWTATATNVPGEVRGTLTLAISTEPLDLSALLEHQPPKSRAIRPR